MMSFVHIPRTGGTSLLKVFRDWYGDRMISYYSDIEFNENDYDIIFGHKHIANSNYILFLREPYEQQLSYYNYTSRYTKMPSVDEYFSISASTMVKFLPNMDNALFVGIYERFEDDVRRLADLLGKSIDKIPKINSCEIKHEPSVSSRIAFEENNKYIYELYNSYL